MCQFVTYLKIRKQLYYTCFRRHWMLKRIRDLREDDDLTQEYVAKTILNCTRSAYSKMESGTRLISIDDLIKLADFYNVSLDYLVGRVDNKEDHYSKKY